MRWACALGVLLFPVTFPFTSASFTASTSDTGNSATAGTLDPPSNLAVTQVCTTPPAPVFRAGTGATGTGSLTLATPAGVVAGDVLIAHVSNRDNWPLPTPSGWTLVRPRESSGSHVQAAIFWRVATATEPAGVTFTLTGGGGSAMVGGILAYSGVSTTSPVGVSGASTGLSATATTPSVTTTVSNTALVHVLAKRQEALPAPTGTTSRGSNVLAGSLGTVAADEAFVGPGASTSRSSTSATAYSSEWVTFTVALRPPAASTPSASLTWTASPTTTATGYRLERVEGGAVQATSTVTPISTTSTTDGPLVNGTAYTYRLRTYSGTWNSTNATATFTPSC